jgi:hypothetical protein
MTSKEFWSFPLLVMETSSSGGEQMVAESRWQQREDGSREKMAAESRWRQRADSGREQTVAESRWHWD